MIVIYLTILVIIVFFVGITIGCKIPEYIEYNQAKKGIISPKKLAEACLTLRLTEKCKNDFDDFNYSAFNGIKLPHLTGYNCMNALMTYISHGGEKSRAIKRYLENNLENYDEVEAFLDAGDNKIKTDDATVVKED